MSGIIIFLSYAEIHSCERKGLWCVAIFRVYMISRVYTAFQEFFQKEDTNFEIF